VNYGVKKDFDATVELIHSYTNRVTFIKVSYFHVSVAPEQTELSEPTELTEPTEPTK
jgi:hypothetical protein